MIVHAVYFWLRADLSTEQHRIFDEGVRSLTTVPSVRSGFVGRPSATDRPVIDRSYSLALTVIFDDLAGHDAYQTDPIHLRFLAQCRTLWTRVLIYDSDTTL